MSLALVHRGHSLQQVYACDASQACGGRIPEQAPISMLNCRAVRCPTAGLLRSSAAAKRLDRDGGRRCQKAAEAMSCKRPRRKVGRGSRNSLSEDDLYKP